MKVLVVDDEMLVRVGIKTILEGSGGYELIGSASDGEKGLEMVKDLAPDIVITDIKMPRMDGIQLIKDIKRLDDTIGILVLSCYSEFDIVKEAMKYGADEYILKLKMNQDTLIPILDEITEKITSKRKNHVAGTANITWGKSVKFMISDFLAHVYEVEDDKNIFSQETNRSQSFLAVCLCLNCNINNDKTLVLSGTVEDIVENVVNEYYNGWCTKIDDYEYSIVIITDKIDPDLFKNTLNEISTHCIKVIFELLNIATVMFIGSVENKPRKIDISLRNALRAQEYIRKNRYFSNGTVIYDYEVLKDYEDFNTGNLAENNAVSEDVGSWEKIYGRIELLLKDTEKLPHTIQTAINYINEYYSKELTLNEIANVVNLNPAYFSSLFNNVVNVTFSNYLMCLRIYKAKILLKETNDKIYEIAEEVGYKNSYYFNRIFKKIVGITPVEFRNIT
jgi:two-component system response regulator YesN